MVSVEVKGQGRKSVIEVTVRPLGKDAIDLNFGSIPQSFGVYIIGPWGFVPPDPGKIRSDNWMHQQVSTSQQIRLTRDDPLVVRIVLSDWYQTSDPQIFRSGRYQVNVKFFDLESMTVPADSGPAFIIIEAGAE